MFWLLVDILYFTFNLSTTLERVLYNVVYIILLRYLRYRRDELHCPWTEDPHLLGRWSATQRNCRPDL